MATNTNLGISVDIRPNIKVMAGLKTIPDRVIWNVARNVLDQSRSDGIIPKDTGKLRTTSMKGGVQKMSNGSYYIGSYTSYAKYVWKMPNGTNWSEPGSSSQWYTKTIERHGQTIIHNAINKGWRETM